MRKRKKEPTLRAIRRTVSDAQSSLTVFGEEGGALASRSYVTRIAVGPRGGGWADRRCLDLNRSETRRLRDALTRILGDG